MAHNAQRVALVLAMFAGSCIMSAEAVGLRSMLAAVDTFPYRKCSAAPTGSPYVLSASDPTIVESNLYLNTTVVANPNADFGSNCYSTLLNSLFKVVIKSTTQCQRKVSVYVNDVLKRGSVYWDVQKDGSALLRVTKLDLGAGSLGARITLVGVAPCNTFAALSGGADTLTYYATPSPSSKCCPVNTLSWVHRSGQGEVSSEVSGEISGGGNGQSEESSSAEQSSA